MIMLSVALGLLAALLIIFCSVLGVQILAAVSPVRGNAKVNDISTSSLDVCVLMPAHNEATGIAEVIQSIVPQLNARSRLLVVADNCTDTTAAIIRDLMTSCEFIEVVERHNAQLRGKGYALDHGIRHLASHPPDVVVVVDADCELSYNTVDIVTRHCISTKRPVQALYLMRSPEGASLKVKLAEFAWLVKNKVRALGFHHMGLPCQLMGSGMAFTWEQISSAKLASGQIVEDMQLGMDLALAGTPPLFCPTALVTSSFPSTVAALNTQRTRWEHGHIGIIFSQVPVLLWQGIRCRNMALLAMALDLCVPPLALLTLLIGSTLVASLVLAMNGGSVMPSILATVAFTIVGMAVFTAWFGFGQGVISIWQLLQMPVYVLKKIPMYLYFFVKRQSSWVRSKRDGEL